MIFCRIIEIAFAVRNDDTFLRNSLTDVLLFRLFLLFLLFLLSSRLKTVTPAGLSEDPVEELEVRFIALIEIMCGRIIGKELKEDVNVTQQILKDLAKGFSEI